MSLPDISFEKIRSYDGSQNMGFEELCCQLAGLEHTVPDENFFRKGRGGDAGVECYVVKSDGSEIGWQAKYVFKWDDGLVKLLNESISVALKNHPQLNKYIVCLPFDLPDSRSGRGKTSLEKWQAWTQKWITTAANESRVIVIELWGKSELAARLTRDAASYSGRLMYWFEKESFTDNWFREQFEKARVALGTRYTPESNVELPIRKDFLTFVRHISLQRRVDKWFQDIAEKGHTALNAILKISVDDASNQSKELRDSIDKIYLALNGYQVKLHLSLPLENWVHKAEQCYAETRKALLWVQSLPISEKSSNSTPPEKWAEHALHVFLGVLGDVKHSLKSKHWEIANAEAVLLRGPAGIGKSHLLADLVEAQVYSGVPAVLILGASLNEGEPWRQILTLLDRPATEQVKHFLGAIDSAAEAAGSKALICIDALNERKGLDIWPSHLSAFLTMAAQYPRIALVISCRSTYVDYVMPDGLIPKSLFILEHEGFSENGGEAAKIYLNKRGIVRLGAPNLVPEFENPLFLKTCCDYLDKEGKKELPRGLRGITSIFSFYNEAIEKSLSRRMRLDSRFGIVPKAISGFALLVANAERGYIEKNTAIDFFESIQRSDGVLERSLLSQLEAEGLVTVELVLDDFGKQTEMVRFMFERFSDHAIASRLIADNVVVGQVSHAFKPGQPLHEYVFGENAYVRAGVIEAIAIQLAEIHGIEILDVGNRATWTMKNAFLDSLLWREQRHFTDRTYELADKYMSQYELNNLLISISTEPDNKFNAIFIYHQLIKLTLSDRDAYWSTFVAENGYAGNVETLISWAIHNGFDAIDDDRAVLAAISLTWFLTTSNREVRDKATKALSCLLSRRLNLASKLVRKFVETNDPYLVERLIGACYGACMQGNDEGLKDLTQTVFDCFFSEGKPPLNALLRDHAQGIIQYATWRGVTVTVDLSKIRPPFDGASPIELVSDDVIESYTETSSHGTYHDSIVSSTIMDGDFARYQLDHKVDRWSPASFGTRPLPTSRDVYESWRSKFLAAAKKPAKKAFSDFLQFVDETKAIRDYPETSESKERNAKELKFKDRISPQSWEEYRVEARNFVRYQLYTDWSRDLPATFNIQLARRWICKRAHDLGWTQDLFANFESENCGHDRHDHKIERIGKKYQWIALHELLARLADNNAYVESTYSNQTEVLLYTSARQISIRDIDPSLLLTKTFYDGWAQWDKTWWVPIGVQLRACNPTDRIAWLESDIDVINDKALIDLTDPKTKRTWLALRSFSSWRGNGVKNGNKIFERDCWFRLNCLVVKVADRQKLIESLKGEILTSPHALPEIELDSDFYLGEYPWHPDLQIGDDWNPVNERLKIPVKTRNTVAEYRCESGGYDYSIDQTIGVEIPAPWLAKSMGLRMANGLKPEYVNSVGDVIFFDPSVMTPGPSAALIDRDIFLEMLERENLAAVWVIAGEKGVYGGRPSGRGFGGRFQHTGIYELYDGKFNRIFHENWERPSASQIKDLLEE